MPTALPLPLTNMPVPIPGADLHAINSRSNHQGHQRLADEEEEVGVAPYLSAADGVRKLESEHDIGKYGTTYGQEEDGYSGKVDEEGQYSTPAQTLRPRTKAQRFKELLVKHGVEARATEPVPEEVCLHALFIEYRTYSIALQERTDLRWWSLIPQFTLWAAANTNILSFSAGVLGPNLFGLDFKSSVWVIIVFNLLSAIPVAYFATFGPLLGMRQMVQTRYSFGYVRCDCYSSVKWS